MIVRISGMGQFDLDDAGVRKLDEMDTALTQALEDGDKQRFHEFLCSAIDFVRSNGAPIGSDSVLPSEVIIPPEDVDLEEARKFFTDEGLMQPLPA